MKTILLMSITPLVLCSALSMTKTPVVRDSSESDNSTGNSQVCALLDVGLPSPGSDNAEGWRASVAVRAGIGFPITDHLDVYGFFDYYLHRPIRGDFLTPTTMSPLSAKRQDVAIYGTVVALGFLSVGVGTFYTTSDAVSLKGPWGQTQMKETGFSDVRFLYTFGLVHEFVISKKLFIPAELFYRNSYAVNNTLPVYLRIGVGIRL